MRYSKPVTKALDGVWPYTNRNKATSVTVHIQNQRAYQEDRGIQFALPLQGKNHEDIQNALKETVRQLEQQIQSLNYLFTQGSTLNVCASFQHEDDIHIITANVGDSYTWLINTSDAATQPKHPLNIVESYTDERFNATFEQMKQAGMISILPRHPDQPEDHIDYTVFGNLRLMNSMGDQHTKQMRQTQQQKKYFTGQASCTHHTIKVTDAGKYILATCTDGLDILSAEDFARIYRRAYTRMQSTEQKKPSEQVLLKTGKAIKKALELNASDNATCIMSFADNATKHPNTIQISAVFDGHGGPRVSEHLQNIFIPLFSYNLLGVVVFNNKHNRFNAPRNLPIIQAQERSVNHLSQIDPSYYSAIDFLQRDANPKHFDIAHVLYHLACDAPETAKKIDYDKLYELACNQFIAAYRIQNHQNRQATIQSVATLCRNIKTQTYEQLLQTYFKATARSNTDIETILKPIYHLLMQTEAISTRYLGCALPAQNEDITNSINHLVRYARYTYLFPNDINNYPSSDTTAPTQCYISYIQQWHDWLQQTNKNNHTQQIKTQKKHLKTTPHQQRLNAWKPINYKGVAFASLLLSVIVISLYEASNRHNVFKNNMQITDINHLTLASAITLAGSITLCILCAYRSKRESAVNYQDELKLVHAEKQLLKKLEKEIKKPTPSIRDRLLVHPHHDQYRTMQNNHTPDGEEEKGLDPRMMTSSRV